MFKIFDCSDECGSGFLLDDFLEHTYRFGISQLLLVVLFKFNKSIRFISMKPLS